MASAKNGYMGEGSKKEAAAMINPYRKWLERRPDPSSIDAERMQVAEEIAGREVLHKIHPTLDEDEKRADITLFLQTLITHSFHGVEVIFFITLIDFSFYCCLHFLFFHDASFFLITFI